ncbi:phage-shock protein [Pseudoalteromonas porphyrae]|uniref:PspA/IM30 family protein n=1 Tax=Pseudoalteromonas neustonica TaxID=1840331 RepID=A0ABU9U7T9_9GAMM|nr:MULTISPECIES: PspA/IM30 family protein [Pseudoalteromonas]KPH96525.1 phage-shock protein [Pseudoalteromonas porphyrae]
MGLVNRVSDLIQSNIVAALDKAEDPQKLLNLLIQEMQQALGECRATAAAILCEEKVLRRQQTEKQNSITQWQEKAEIAVSKGRDDLAAAALKEKQRVVSDLAAIEPELVKLTDSLEKLQDDAQRLQEKLGAAKAKQRSLLQVHNVVNARVRVNHQLNSEKVAHALSRFDVIERRVDAIEAQVEAYEITDSANQNTTADQIDALVKNDALEQELAALKIKVKKSA